MKGADETSGKGGAQPENRRDCQGDSSMAHEKAEHTAINTGATTKTDSDLKRPESPIASVIVRRRWMRARHPITLHLVLCNLPRHESLL